MEKGMEKTIADDIYAYIQYLSRENGELYTLLLQRLRNGSKAARRVVKEHASAITSEEFDAASNYMNTGIFRDLPEDEALAAYSIVLQAEYERNLSREISKCKPYTGEEPLFSDRKMSEARHDELIDYSELQRINDGYIIKVGQQWASIDTRINSFFFHWFDDCFPNKERFVRVDPYSLSATPPKQLVTEIMIIPPKKDWWQNLSIYKGTHVGSAYMLHGGDVNDIEDYNDFHFLNVRRLEVSVTRNNSGNLSMMIEELTQYPHPTDTSRQYVVGRMIHLDSNAKVGTPFDNAVLNHIDLAINLYIDDTATNRMNQNLAINGRIEKASVRTHILRVNSIPFNSLIKFAYAFFKSKKLVDEWKEAEFM